MSRIPTIKIKDPGDRDLGYIIINESDFDPDYHERFEESKAEKAAKKKGSDEKTETPPAPTGEANDADAGQEGQDAEDGEGSREDNPDAEEAVDLREVPVSEGRLEAAVAGIEDVALLETLRDSDDRTSATPVYQARIDELKA